MHALAEFFKEGGPFMVVTWDQCGRHRDHRRTDHRLAFKLNLKRGPFMEQIQKLVLSGTWTGP